MKGRHLTECVWPGGANKQKELPRRRQFKALVVLAGVRPIKMRQSTLDACSDILLASLSLEFRSNPPKWLEPPSIGWTLRRIVPRAAPLLQGTRAKLAETGPNSVELP